MDPTRDRPRLTFFVELAERPLETLFRRPDVLPFLREGGHAVSLGLVDLSRGRAEVVRHLEAAGVPVTAWLLLDVEDGYWLNADNAHLATRRWRETREWAEREGLRLHRVGRLEAEAIAGTDTASTEPQDPNDPRSVDYHGEMLAQNRGTRARDLFEHTLAQVSLIESRNSLSLDRALNRYRKLQERDMGSSSSS